MTKVYEGDKPFLFVSYSHLDKEVAIICDYLRRNMCRIWYDEGNHSGDDWSDNIAAHLLKSQCVLYLISNNSLKSKYVNAEVTMALGHGKQIIPIRIEDINLSPGMELKIGHLHFVDVFNEESINQKCEIISSQIPKELYDFCGSPFYRNDKYSFYLQVVELKEWQIGFERKMSIVAVSETTKKVKELYSFVTDPSVEPYYRVLGVDKVENNYFDEKNNDTLFVQILCSFQIEYPLYGNGVEALFSIGIVDPINERIKGLPVSCKIISPKDMLYDPNKTINELEAEAQYYEKSVIKQIINRFDKGDKNE